MQKLLTSALLITGLSATAQAASLDDAFKKGTTSGQLRFGYISKTPDVTGNPTTTGAAMGGEIKFETAKWNRFQLALAPYFVEKVDDLSGDGTKVNGDFFNSTNEGYAYLGEAYVTYSFKGGSLRYGRQKLDTPFINTDDIRMFSNTFTAAWLNMELSKSLTLDVGQVSTWAGFDSGSSQEDFKRASNDGVSALGITYNHSDNLSTQAWYYNFDKAYSLLYADATYSMGDLEFGVQLGSYSEDNASGTDGTVVGASITYSTGPLTLAAVINSGSNDDGKSASLGLGGGNYYAAMDESTIDGLNDAKAHVVSAEYAVSENFTAGVAVGHFENNNASTKIDESNVVLGYSANDTFNMEFIHTTVDDAGTANDFSRQTLRATYSF